jgi:hypothetical protein
MNVPEGPPMVEVEASVVDAGIDVVTVGGGGVVSVV